MYSSGAGRCRNGICLVEGSKESEGEVEVGGTKYVCDDGWGMADAAVVCRQLGFPGVIQFTRETYFKRVTRSSSRTSIGFDDVKCVGTEMRLEDCDHSTSHDCSSSELAGVVCAEQATDIVPADCRAVGKICLIGGPDQFSGNVYYQGRPVCDYGWDYAAGFVVCRQLGYDYPDRITKKGEFGNCLDYFSMYNVKCNGNETDISDCEYETDSGNRPHTAVAGVVCKSGLGVTKQQSSYIVWITMGVLIVALIAFFALFVVKKNYFRRGMALLDRSDSI